MSNAPPDVTRLTAAFFEPNRGRWIAEGREGQWAVIGDDGLVAFRPKFRPAYALAVARFGHDKPMLVKQVVDDAEAARRAAEFAWSDRKSR